MGDTPGPTYGADGRESACIDISRNEAFLDETFRVTQPVSKVTRDGGYSFDES